MYLGVRMCVYMWDVRFCAHVQACVNAFSVFDTSLSVMYRYVHVCTLMSVHACRACRDTGTRDTAGMAAALSGKGTNAWRFWRIKKGIQHGTKMYPS